jgi:dissimilatory sulfite reductase (desulfoviridin) alpha/beta subunit
MNCGLCIEVCQSGTLVEGYRGFRIQLGGKLGRHPKLAEELPGIFNEAEAVQIVQSCLEVYKQTARGGIRFSEIFKQIDVKHLLSVLNRSQNQDSCLFRDFI